MSLNYRLFPERIRRLFGSMVQEEKDLDHWHFDMMGQTMLIRNADGDYTPAHRSLLEFFVAYKFAAELGALAPDFTELAQSQSCLDKSATPQDYTWSAYFSHQLDETRRSIAIPALRAFTNESLAQLRQTFGQAPLTKAVMDLLLPMVNIHSRITQSPHHPIIKILKATCGKTEAEVSCTGGNAATLLVKVDKEALESCDLSHTLILGADFTDASLRNVNFTNANLGSSKFNKILSRPLSVAFSPDGKMFATGDASGDIRLWQATDNLQTLLCKGHIDWVRSVVFSPDGTILASGSDDQTVKIWDIKTGECLKTLQGHTSRVFPVNILQGHTSPIWSVNFSFDGKTLVSGSLDETIKLWDIKTGQCFKNLTHERPYEGMNIMGVMGLTEAEKVSLKALGAVESE